MSGSDALGRAVENAPGFGIDRVRQTLDGHHTLEALKTRTFGWLWPVLILAGVSASGFAILLVDKIACGKSLALDTTLLAALCNKMPPTDNRRRVELALTPKTR